MLVAQFKTDAASGRSFFAVCGPQQAALPGVGAAGADIAASSTSPHTTIRHFLNV